MSKRVRALIVALVVVACLVGIISSAAAKPTRKSFCKYVRAHTFEFTAIFDQSTNPIIAAASSEQEIKRLQARAPAVLQADLKTFRMLLVAIRTQDSAAISAVAPDAGAASARILNYVKTKCGVSVTTPTA